MSILRIKNNSGNWVEIPVIEGKSAYQSAVSGGYNGTEADFNAMLYNTPTHVIDYNNPHHTTYEQVGAYSSGQTDTLLLNKVDKNTPIDGGIYTKITFDSKGLVTSGQTATTNDIPDSLDKRYVTDDLYSGITHTNRTVIDLLTDSGNTLYYNGSQVGTVQIQSDFNQNDSGSTDYIKNRPSITSLSGYTISETNTLLDLRVTTGTTVNGHLLNGDVVVTPTDLGVYTSGQTNTLLDGKSNTGHTHSSLSSPNGTITPVTVDNGSGMVTVTRPLIINYDDQGGTPALTINSDGDARIQLVNMPGNENYSEIAFATDDGTGKSNNWGLVGTPTEFDIYDYNTGSNPFILNNSGFTFDRKITLSNLVGITSEILSVNSLGDIEKGQMTTSNLPDSLNKRYVTDALYSGITHTNRTVIDALTDSGGTLYYNGGQVGSVQIQADFEQNNSGATDYIKNKPTITSLSGYTSGQTDTLLNTKVDKVLNKSLVFDTEIAKIHTQNSDSILLSPDKTKTVIQTDNAGNLIVSGNIIQSGTTYETHVTNIFTSGDTMTLREGAIAGLSVGQYAGFTIKKYDGVNDGQLVFDNTGIARVGGSGSTQAIATREDTPTNDYIAKWNSSTNRFETIIRNTSSIPDSSNKRYVTDANLIVIDNTSNTNSGDEVYIGTTPPPSGHTFDIWFNTDATGTTSYTVNQVDNLLNLRVSTGTTVNGYPLSSNVVITASDIYAYTSGETNSLLSNYSLISKRNSLTEVQTFTTITGSTITPNFDGILNNNDLFKINSNYVGGTIVTISSYTNLPTFDICKNVVVTNLKGSDITFNFATSDQVYSGVTYSFKFMGGSSASSILVPTTKTIDILYTFEYTSSTSCVVSIIYKVEL